MSEFTLVALKDEIENDTESIGYKNSPTSGDWKGDQIIADLINVKNLVIDRVSVEMELVRASTEYQWYNTLSADEQEWLRWQSPNGGMWVVSADMKLQLSGRTPTSNGVAGTGANNDSFWAASQDQDAAPVMLALIEIAGSRAEVLWDEGKFVTVGEVGRAFNEI